MISPIRLTIALDIDETIADLLGAACNRLNLRHDSRLLPENIRTWDVPERMLAVFRDADMYDHVVPIPGARKVVEQLRGLGHRVIFVTACPYGTADQKVNWLYRWGFIDALDSHPDVVCAADKSLVRADLLVDDRPLNCTSFPGPAILITQPHNENEDVPVYRVKSITEVPDLVSEIVEALGEGQEDEFFPGLPDLLDDEEDVEHVSRFAPVEMEVNDSDEEEVPLEVRLTPADLLEAAIPVAQRLANERGEQGITVTDVELELRGMGILQGNEDRETMSVLGHVCRKAGLVKGTRERCDRLAKKHSNVRLRWYARPRVGF